MDQVDELAEDQDINVNSSDGHSLPLVSDVSVFPSSFMG